MAVSRIRDHGHLIPLGDGPAEASRALLRTLYLGVWAVLGGDVRGDIAEFGTMSGLTARALAKAIAQNGLRRRRERRLLLFDSFGGLPATESDIDAESPHLRHGHWRAGLCRGATPEELRDFVGTYLPADRFDIYPGWFSETIPSVPSDTRLALVHVDCDYYQSTLDAMRPCFDNGWLTEGAHLFFDDWNCNRASRDFGQRRAWRELCEAFEIDYSGGGDYASFGHKIIVHGYRGMPPEESDTA